MMIDLLVTLELATDLCSAGFNRIFIAGIREEQLNTFNNTGETTFCLRQGN